MPGIKGKQFRGWVIALLCTAVFTQVSAQEVSAQKIYDTNCRECHEKGLHGSPKFGDKADWKKFVDAGLSELIPMAVRGAKLMPPRGGNPDLSDEEMVRAVVFMTNAAGGKFSEPSAKEVRWWLEEDSHRVSRELRKSTGLVLSGEAVYRNACWECHAQGLHGAPRFGDATAWKASIAKGLPELVPAVIQGKRKMPPRGGAPDLTDVEVARAVVFMSNAAGANFTQPDEAQVTQWLTRKPEPSQAKQPSPAEIVQASQASR